MRKTFAVSTCMLFAMLAGNSVPAQQTTAFTWQGRVTNNGAPASGHYDLLFRLYTDAAGTSQIGSDVCIDDLTISNGLVTADLDFGVSAFTGPARWLDVALRPNTGLDCSVSTGFTSVSPRRRVTPAPYAINADRLDNLDSSSFMTKSVYDSDNDQLVDSAAIDFPLISSLSAPDGNPAVALMASNSGNIGVGTLNPQFPFQVNGAIGSGLSGLTIGNPPLARVGIDQHTGDFSIGAAGESILVSNNGAGFSQISGENRWQSFTAPSNANVGAIEVQMSDFRGPTHTSVVRIYAGEGTASTPITSSAGTLSPAVGSFDWQRVQFDPPFAIQSGQMYTIEVVGNGFLNNTWLFSAGNTYPGGRSDLDPNFDKAFRVIETTSPTPDLSISSNHQVGVGIQQPVNKLDVGGGVAIGTGMAGVSAAPANGLLVQGKVGLGTATPVSALDVEGSVAIGTGYAGSATPPSNSLIVESRLGINTVLPANELDVAGTAVIGSSYAGALAAPSNSLLVQNRVGIGTMSPQNRMDVAGGVVIGNNYAGTVSGLSEGLMVQGRASIGTTNTMGNITSNAGSFLNALFLDGSHTSGTWMEIRNNTAGGATWAMVSSGSANTGGAGNLLLLSGATTQAVFTSAGRNGFGRVPTTNRLEVEGNASKTVAGGFIANSDVRIKTGIQPVTKAVDTLMKVRPVTFHYTPEYRKEHPSIADRPYHNIIAQEYAEVFPDYVQPSGERVPGTDDEILQADTHALTIVSVAAIQELQREVELLREVNQRQDSMIQKQQELLDRMENRIGHEDLAVRKVSSSSGTQ